MEQWLDIEAEAFELGLIAATPTSGRYYQIQRGDSLLTVAGRAYGVGAGAERLTFARLINEHARNQKFVRSQEADNLFPKGKVSFLPRFACDPEAQIKGVQAPAGGCYAVLWLPPQREPRPVKPVEPKKPEPAQKRPSRKQWQGPKIRIGPPYCPAALPKERERDVRSDLHHYWEFAVETTREALRRITILDAMKPAERGAAWDKGLERMWFGRYSARAYYDVRKLITQLYAVLRDPQLTIQCDTIKGCRRKHNAIAWREKFPSTIFLCKPWFAEMKNPLETTDRKQWNTEILVHEAAHLAGAHRTLFREAYPRENAKRLARRNPLGARRNAQNYAYYILSFRSF